MFAEVDVPEKIEWFRVLQFVWLLIIVMRGNILLQLASERDGGSPFGARDSRVAEL